MKKNKLELREDDQAGFLDGKFFPYVREMFKKMFPEKQHRSMSTPLESFRMDIIDFGTTPPSILTLKEEEE